MLFDTCYIDLILIFFKTVLGIGARNQKEFIIYIYTCTGTSSMGLR